MPDRRRQELCDLPLLEVATRIRSREVSPVEATESVLARIDALEGTLNAFVTVLSEEALASARAAEREIQSGHYRGWLHGVPLSVKDLFATKGLRTTASSRVLADHVPDYDATVVERLRDAGAVIVGKTNMLEFAYAAVHPDFGPTPNPWDLTRSSSGSSSGSAVSVAAGMGYGSVGSDTGGSIRLPAAYCGIVGLKPTYGRVSRYGGIPVSWSADHFGPITRTVWGRRRAPRRHCRRRPARPDQRPRAGAGLRRGLVRRWHRAVRGSASANSTSAITSMRR